MRSSRSRAVAGLVSARRRRPRPRAMAEDDPDMLDELADEAASLEEEFERRQFSSPSPAPRFWTGYLQHLRRRRRHRSAGLGANASAHVPALGGE